MSSPQNISAVDANSPRQYFNNYFTGVSTITSNQNDAIIGYFQQHTNGNKVAADALASAVVYTSLNQGMDPMAILQQFTQLPKGELNSYLTMFLNLNRVGTSFLGINNQPIVNKYIKRSILA
jgi:hypothetical protein